MILVWADTICIRPIITVIKYLFMIIQGEAICKEIGSRYLTINPLHMCLCKFLAIHLMVMTMSAVNISMVILIVAMSHFMIMRVRSIITIAFHNVTLFSSVRREFDEYRLLCISEKKTEFDLPNYEKFLDSEGHYISDQRMIDYLLSWSRDNKHTPSRSREDIISLYEKLNLEEIDKFQLSSGHDVSYMIAYFIWKHISKEKTDKEEIEMLLRASYTSDSFQKTALYYDLAGWCADNDMIILK